MEEINLKELFSYFLGKFWIIIILSLISVCAMWGYIEYFQKPLYKSSTTLVLTTSETNTTITQSDVSLNQKLVPTYREIMKSKRVLGQVVQNLNLDCSWQSIQNSISVTTENDTELIRISVSNENAKMASDIANEITTVFAKEIVEIYSIDNVSVIDYAEKANEPYNVNIIKQMIIALVCAIVLGSGIIFVIFYFDTTIKSTDDIENKLGLIVLGSVPKTKARSKKSKRGNK